MYYYKNVIDDKVVGITTSKNKLYIEDFIEIDEEELKELICIFGVPDGYQMSPKPPIETDTDYTEQERIDWLEGMMKASGYIPESEVEPDDE